MSFPPFPLQITDRNYPCS